MQHTYLDCVLRRREVREYNCGGQQPNGRKQFLAFHRFTPSFWLRNDSLHLDLETDSRLPEIFFLSIESDVLVERHHARVELLDDVVEVHFCRLLVIAWPNPVRELRLGILAEDLELTYADLVGEQVASKRIRSLALGEVRVVSTQSIVVRILTFDRNHTGVGQFPFEEEIDGCRSVAGLNLSRSSDGKQVL